MKLIPVFKDSESMDKNLFVPTAIKKPTRSPFPEDGKYSRTFFTSFIKPGKVPNLLKLCSLDGVTWGSTISVAGEVKVTSLLVRITMGDKAYYGTINGDPTTGLLSLKKTSGSERVYAFREDIMPENALVIFEYPEPNYGYDISVPRLPLDITFDATSYTLTLKESAVGTVSLVGIAVEIETVENKDNS